MNLPGILQGKGKIIAIVVLLIAAAIIVYMMLTNKTTGELTDVPITPAELPPPTKEGVDWADYKFDDITDGPNTKKAGATQIWVDGKIYPIPAPIPGGVGYYKNKPSFLTPKP